MNEARQEHPSVTAEKRIQVLRAKLQQEREKQVHAYYAETAMESGRLHFVGFIEAVDLCLSMVLSDVKRTRQGEFS